jgi:hypothetical protein
MTASPTPRQWRHLCAATRRPAAATVAYDRAAELAAYAAAVAAR